MCPCVSGNGECVCVCVCVFHGSLCSCCGGQITLMNQQLLKREIKRTEDGRGFYLFLKYYVVPISCFVKVMNVQFPSRPQRPRPSHNSHPYLSLSVTQYFISVVSAHKDKANHSLDSADIGQFCETQILLHSDVFEPSVPIIFHSFNICIWHLQ